MLFSVVKVPTKQFDNYFVNGTSTKPNLVTSIIHVTTKLDRKCDVTPIEIFNTCTQ